MRLPFWAFIALSVACLGWAGTSFVGGGGDAKAFKKAIDSTPPAFVNVEDFNPDNYKDAPREVALRGQLSDFSFSVSSSVLSKNILGLISTTADMANAEPEVLLVQTEDMDVEMLPFIVGSGPAAPIVEIRGLFTSAGSFERTIKEELKKQGHSSDIAYIDPFMNDRGTELSDAAPTAKGHATLPLVMAAVFGGIGAFKFLRRPKPAPAL